MGHTICHRTYDEKVNKRKVQDEWDIVVQHEDYQEGASGLPNPIRWIDKTFDSYDEAMEYIDKIDSGWYDQIAVKYRDYSNIKPTKAYENLIEKRVKSIQKVRELNDTFYFQNAKVQNIGCKNCGSKLSLKYLRTNYCPLCKTDLRPESAIKRIETAKTNAKKAEKELEKAKKELERKQVKQAKIKWLVKVEYHT